MTREFCNGYPIGNTELVGTAPDGRPIIRFPKEPHLKSSEEKWGVPKLKGAKIRKRLLVLGTGRSGTVFTAKALQTVGINVLHEKVGEHGTVSHYFVIDSDWYPMAPWQESQQKKHVGERRSDFRFDHVFQIVRDPRKSIPSMTKIFGSVTWRFYEENGLIPEGIKNPMLRAMHYWYAHTKFGREQATYTFQLERYAQAWPVLMEQLGETAPYPEHLRPMNKTSGFKKYEPITFDDMRNIDPALGRNIVKLARELGYKEA